MTGALAFCRRFARNRAALAGLVLLLAILLMAALAGVLFPDDPWDMVAQPLLWPGQDGEYPLGSDLMGRDLMSGLFHGARVSLAFGFTATAAALLIGVTAGALAGYYGGLVDDVLMRITELFQTVPPFILAIVLVVILTPSALTIVTAIALVSWPGVARLVRAEFLSLRGREFVQAGVVLGMGDARLILTQILPNALGPIIVSASLMVATSILLEASLAFLGLGDPNLMSWGTIIGAGRDALRSAWYVAALPGAAILVTVLAFSLVGEGLNDALNPRLRNR
ncbi:ABC transporter permease [Methylobacterium aquaticum]|uniref:ABC transporter permease n=1 Tax=Methylobacterium aquaticum TaxID=270351 RepID=A0A0J6SSF5_9HYPH|nr:ABC transporter permease [Methylobacterium aquaticum]KMO36308.1 ABC transporter permease [Methylobacterium aquaticum]